jgi:hypothetical protein
VITNTIQQNPGLTIPEHQHSKCFTEPGFKCHAKRATFQVDAITNGFDTKNYNFLQNPALLLEG